MNRKLFSLLIIATVLVIGYAMPKIAFAQNDEWPDSGDSWPAESEEEATLGGGGSVQEREVAGAAPQTEKGGLSSVWIWVLLGLFFVFILILFVVLVVVMIARINKSNAEARRREQQHREEREEIQRKVESIRHDSEAKDDVIRQLKEQQQEPGDDAALMKQEMTRVAETKPVLQAILIDEKTGVPQTCQLHIADNTGHVTHAPKRSIGTAADCDVQVSKDTVSRYHCNLRADYEGNVYVKDLDSTNGTWIERDGTLTPRVEGRAEVQNEDVLVLGGQNPYDSARLKVIIQRFRLNEPLD